MKKRLVTHFATPGKQQYAWQSSAAPNNSLPTPTTFLKKKSAEVEFYIRATKPVRSKWGRCQSGARWQGTENAWRLPLCARLRPLRRIKQTLRRLPSFAASRTRGRCCAAASLSNQGYHSFLLRRKGLSGSAKFFFLTGTRESMPLLPLF